jgi:hypothetical protein
MLMFPYNTRGEKVGAVEMQTLSKNEITATISENETRIALSLHISRNASGEIEIQGSLNDQKFTISGRPGDGQSARVAGKLTLDTDQIKLLNQWGRLTDSLLSMSEALRTEQTGRAGQIVRIWGCGSCLLLGGGILVSTAACLEGALPACGTALAGGGTFGENCEGACA